jgi:FkbM family methyltransferase
MHRPRAAIWRFAHRRRTPTTFEEVAIAHARYTPDFFFIQIGAFDGRTEDPIHDMVIEHGWSGILLEPRRRYFEELLRTYADRAGLQFRNAAVSEEPGMRTMYGIPPHADLPGWAPEVASFDRGLLARTGLPDLDRRIETEEVQCVTLEAVLEQAPAGHLDLLQIDAEGYDAQILEMLDLDRFRPTIIHFEHHALASEVHTRLLDRLRGHGYRILVEAKDTTAYLASDG